MFVASVAAQLIAKLHNLVTGLPVLRGCGTLLLNGVPELQAAVDAVAIVRSLPVVKPPARGMLTYLKPRRLVGRLVKWTHGLSFAWSFSVSDSACSHALGNVVDLVLDSIVWDFVRVGSVATLVVCLFTVFVVAGDSRNSSQASGAGMVVVLTLNLGRVHYVLWSAVARASRTLISFRRGGAVVDDATDLPQ